MAEPRTKQTAIDTLEEMRQDAVEKMEDPEIASLLSEDLLKLVFNEAWRLQFEDEPAEFMRAARDLVVDAASQAQNRESK